MTVPANYDAVSLTIAPTLVYDTGLNLKTADGSLSAVGEINWTATP